MVIASFLEFLHLLHIVVAVCAGASPRNQICSQGDNIYLVQSLPQSKTSKTFPVDFLSVGLFDWKKDRKFFARFEEPVSPEREYAVEDGDYPLPCSPTCVLPCSLAPSARSAFKPSSCCFIVRAKLSLVLTAMPSPSVCVCVCTAPCPV